MGWRYRKSIRILPFLRFNITHRGTSWSAGGSPYTVNVSKRGVRETLSIPETGISHVSQHAVPESPFRSGSATFLTRLLCGSAAVIALILWANWPSGANRPLATTPSVSASETPAPAPRPAQHKPGKGSH